MIKKAAAFVAIIVLVIVAASVAGCTGSSTSSASPTNRPAESTTLPQATWSQPYFDPLEGGMVKKAGVYPWQQGPSIEPGWKPANL